MTWMFYDVNVRWRQYSMTWTLYDVNALWRERLGPRAPGPTCRALGQKPKRHAAQFCAKLSACQPPIIFPRPVCEKKVVFMKAATHAWKWSQKRSLRDPPGGADRSGREHDPAPGQTHENQRSPRDPWAPTWEVSRWSSFKITGHKGPLEKLGATGNCGLTVEEQNY